MIRVAPNQSLIDIAIQHCGSAEAAYALAVANGISVTADLLVSQELVSVPVMNQAIVDYYAKNKTVPAKVQVDGTSGIVLFNEYIVRVIADGGVVENKDCAISFLQSLDQEILNKATLIMYPSGYKVGKIHSIKPTDGSGDITFTRSSTARRRNEAGLQEESDIDTPRIDYRVNGCGKLLVETQRTNSFLKSSKFDDAYWQKDGVTVSPDTLGTLDPSGNNLADKVVEDASTGMHRVRKSNFPAGVDRPFIITAKKAERDYIRIYENNALPIELKAGVVFDLNNGTVFSNYNASYYKNPTIIDEGNGWYTCSVNWDSFGLSVPSFGISPDGVAQEYEGTPGSGIYVIDANLQEGAYPTSNIPTDVSTVTRLKDTPTLGSLQANSIFGATTGTIVIELEWSESGYIFDLNDSGGTRLRIYNNLDELWIRDLVGASWYRTGLEFTQGDTAIIGVAWDGTTVQAFQNGVKAASSKIFASSMAIDNFTGMKTNATGFIYAANTVLSDEKIISLTTL